MSALILPSRFRQQPQQPTEIDTGNPLTRGLSTAFNPAVGAFFNGRAANVGGTTVSRVVSEAGISTRYNGSNGHYFSAEANAPTNNESTLLVIARPVSVETATRSIFGFSINSTTSYLNFVGQGTAGNLIYWARDASGATQALEGAGGAAWANGKLATVVGTRSQTQNFHKVWLNKSLLNSATATALTVPSPPQHVSVGGLWRSNSIGINFNGDVYLALAWNRGMSDAEVRELVDNPWQVFKPVQTRRIWVAASTAAVVGTSGDDRLVGSAGPDTFTGNGGADIFVFSAATDSPPNTPYDTMPTVDAPRTWDVIADFVQGTDKIDISAFRTAADGLLGWVGSTPGGAPESVWYRNDNDYGSTFIYVDSNGAEPPELMIELVGTYTLLATDFIGITGGYVAPMALAWTEADDAAVLTGTAAAPSTTGALSWTEDADTAAMTGEVAVPGTLGWMETSDTAAITGEVAVSGVLSWTEAADAMAAIGNITEAGAVSWLDANDAFTGTDGTELATHTTGWIKLPLHTGDAILAGNRLRQSTGAEAGYYLNAAPPAADYSVSCDITRVSGDTTQVVGVVGRASLTAKTFYFACYVQGGDFELYSVVDGVSTLISSQTVAFPVGTTRNLRLEMRGGQIKTFLDGAVDIPLNYVVDFSVTGAGRAGVLFGGADAASDTTGLHIDNFDTADFSPRISSDDFSGVALGTSLSGMAWDDGAVSWGTFSRLMGDGTASLDRDLSTPDSLVLGGWDNTADHVGAALFFLQTAEDQLAPEIIINTTPNTATVLDGLRVRISGGEMQIEDAATGNVSPAVALTPLVSATEYCLELVKTDHASGREYLARLWQDTTNFVRGTLLASLYYTVGTARTAPGVKLAVNATLGQPMKMGRVEALRGVYAVGLAGSGTEAPLGSVTQFAPDGQSVQFLGGCARATTGAYSLEASNGGVPLEPLPFTVTDIDGINGQFGFAITQIPPGDYLPTLTVTGPGGTSIVIGTEVFSIMSVSGGGVAPGPVDGVPSWTETDDLYAIAASNAYVRVVDTLAWTEQDDVVALTGLVRQGVYIGAAWLEDVDVFTATATSAMYAPAALAIDLYETSDVAATLTRTYKRRPAMSTTPTAYTRQVDFTAFESTNPDATKRGVDLDAEFNRILLVLAETQARLAELQRDDGRVANGAVHLDALSDEARAALGTGVIGDSFALGDVTITTGTGSPEGVVTAVPGSLYLRSDGSINTSLYIKQVGDGNLGWMPK